MRPLTEAERKAKRSTLVAAARSFLLERDFPSIRIGEIAARAGVAKGAVFLSFASKEDLFLALAEEEYSAWFTETAAALASLPSPDARSAAAAAYDAFAGRAALARLVAIGPSVLETGATAEAVLSFKRTVLAGITGLSGAVAARTGADAESVGEAFLLAFAALSGAVALTCLPPEAARLVGTEPDLAFFAVDRREVFLSLATPALERALGR